MKPGNNQSKITLKNKERKKKVIKMIKIISDLKKRNLKSKIEDKEK